MAFSSKNARHYFTISALVPTQADGPIEVQGGLTFVSALDRAAFAAELAVSGGLAGVGAIGGRTGLILLSGAFAMDDETNTLALASTLEEMAEGEVHAQTLSVGGKNVVLAGNFTTSGAHSVTLNVAATTNVTLPTSGTLVNEAYVSSAIAGLLGGVQYKGTWNASSNSPAMPAAGSGNKGFCYKVSTAGATAIDGVTDWKVGDMLVSNGGSWDKIDNTDPVQQQLVQKLDYTTTPLAHGSTTVVSPTAAVTEITVSVGTASGQSATINLTGGVPGDQVTILFYGWIGGSSKGSLFINSDGVNIGSIFSSATIAPQVVTIARSRDDAPNNSDPNWFIVGRWYSGKPRGLADHLYYKNDASVIMIYGPQPPSIAMYCYNLPSEGEQIGFELLGSSGTIFSVLFEFDTDSTYTGSVAINVSGCSTNAQYLNALGSALASGYGASFQVIEAFPPDVFTPNPPASLFVQFPGAGGDAYWGSSGTSPNIGIAWIMNGNMGNGPGSYDFGGTSAGTDIHGYVITGDGTQNGIDQPLGVFYQGVPIGTIPANLAAGETKLLDYISAHGRRAVQDNPGGTITIGLSSAPNSGRTRILLFPFNVTGVLQHL